MDPRLTQPREYTQAGLSALKRFAQTLPEAVRQWPRQAAEMVRLPADLLLGGSPEEQSLAKSREEQAYRDVLKGDTRPSLTALPATQLEGSYRSGSPEARAHEVASFINPLQNAVFAPKQALRAINSPLGRSSLGALSALTLGLPDPTVGALGMMGRKGAEARGLNVWKDILDAEFEAAARAKRQGKDPRMTAASGHPLAHTGFDLKPRVEQDISSFLPKSVTPSTGSVPLADAFHLPSWFPKAYPELMDRTRIHLNNQMGFGNGSFDPNSYLIELGTNTSDLSPVSQLALAKHPEITRSRLARTGAHELFGHAVSDIEGFTPGTSPSKMARLASTDPNTQVEKYLVQHSLYGELSEGFDPHALYQEYMTRYPNMSRDIKSIIQNFSTGALDRASAGDSAVYAGERAMRMQPQIDTYNNLHDVLGRGLMEYGPKGMLDDAAGYRPRNPIPFPSDKSYALYRANAGENEAENIAERWGMNLVEKKETPYLTENEMPLKFLHGEYRKGGLVKMKECSCHGH